LVKPKCQCFYLDIFDVPFVFKSTAEMHKAVMDAAAEASQISLAQAEKEDAAALAEARKSMDV
jgi:hypothetical protein